MCTLAAALRRGTLLEGTIEELMARGEAAMRGEIEEGKGEFVLAGQWRRHAVAELLMERRWRLVVGQVDSMESR